MLKRLFSRLFSSKPAAAPAPKPAPAAAKPSRIQTVLKGIGLVSNLWLMFRGARREPKDK